MVDASHAVAALEARGCKPHYAFTPVISDGLTQGTRFMRYSLVSRDAICDAIEIMHEGYKADAIVTLGGCDKSVVRSRVRIRV